jgi:hypothetical protein
MSHDVVAEARAETPVRAVAGRVKQRLLEVGLVHAAV